MSVITSGYEDYYSRPVYVNKTTWKLKEYLADQLKIESTEEPVTDLDDILNGRPFRMTPGLKIISTNTNENEVLSLIKRKITRFHDDYKIIKVDEGLYKFMIENKGNNNSEDKFFIKFREAYLYTSPNVCENTPNSAIQKQTSML